MRLTSIVAAALLLFQVSTAAEITVVSPDKNLRATLEVTDDFTLKVYDGPEELFSVTSLSLAVREGEPFGQTPAIVRTERSSRDTIIEPPVREKYATLHEQFNEAIVTFAGGYGLVLRVYDGGVAYRFVTALPGRIVVDGESFRLALPEIDEDQHTSFRSHSGGRAKNPTG